MKLIEILKGIQSKKIIGDTNIEIDNLSQDTRENFTEKTIYFAVLGTQLNGHDFIKQAIKKGSIAIVCEKIQNKNIVDNIVFVVVDSVSEIMGQIVSNFYDNPSKKLNILAVTGTNGKTTIATLLYQALLDLNKKVALFSTAGDFINRKKIKTNKKASSSMEIIEFQKNLDYAVKEKCEYVCIEATSHALDQNRLNGTKIKGAIYTNLTQDHLNYHKNFDNYAKAKQRLFSILNRDSFAIVNIDDAYGAMMIEKTHAKILTYGNKDKDNPINRDYVFKLINFNMNVTKVYFNDVVMKTSLVGEFNMYNLLASFVTLLELGFGVNEITKVLQEAKGAGGRMELVKGKKDSVIGIVDYAHTPDALENVLKTLQKLPHKRIITVVGVGGDRDRKKRPLMAKIAQENSSYTIFTSDNPRTEDSKQIFNDLISGCNDFNKNYEKIENREKAIEKAVKLSTQGDIILIAGKGHENYQIIGTKKIHFDDREILEKYLP